MSKPLSEINHPHLKVCLDRLDSCYELYNRLNNRLRFIKEGFAQKNDYEKNEIEITVMRTKSEMDALSKVIAGREDYFRGFVKQFAKDLEECEANFDVVMNRAKNKSRSNNALMDLIHRINWVGINTDSEAKVKLYQTMKGFL